MIAGKFFVHIPIVARVFLRPVINEPHGLTEKVVGVIPENEIKVGREERRKR